MKHLLIHCDGACAGNPGPGAVAYRIKSKNKVIKENIVPFAIMTTNQRMELNAAIEALTKAANLRAKSVEIISDSHYLIEGMNNWIHTWIENGWKNAKKKPVENRDLWMTLRLISSQFNKVIWTETRGHQSDEDNNYVDELARKVAQDLKNMAIC